MMFSGFSDTDRAVYRLRPTMRTDRGEPVLDRRNPERTRVESADVQPGAGTESAATGRDATRTDWVVLDHESPRGFWQDTDLVEVDGTAYQIEGGVQEYPSPTGGLSHTQLNVNVWKG